VVIADCLPTAAMRQKFSAIRREYPEIKVIFLYFSARPDPMLAEYLRQSGDVAFKKPVDLDEVTETIRKLVAGAQVSQLTVLRSSDLTAA
jgi:hypothetical protein